MIEAPLSFTGSAKRIWRLTDPGFDDWRQVLLVAAAVVAIALAWSFIGAWYLLWWFWLIPYRLIRRGDRKRWRDALQHRELLDAIERHDRPRLPR